MFFICENKDKMSISVAQHYKGRLVGTGFQEKKAQQLDSPTMLRKSMKLFFSVVANEGLELRSIDIRLAFL